MAERMTVRVVPSGGPEGSLTVEEAMRQVLDTFDLLEKTSSEIQGEVIWRLVEAKTNSPPFTVVAEAHPVRAGVDAVAIARIQKREFAGCVSEVRRGSLPEKWSYGEARRLASTLFARSGNGIAETDIYLGPDEAPIEFRSEDAEIAGLVFEEAVSIPEDKAIKQQVGSIDGILREVATHYNKPALKIRERRFGVDVWCHVPEALRANFADSANFEDVWHGQRVMVRGVLYYDKQGRVTRIEATHIERVSPRGVSVDDIQDPSFTDGLGAEEYLKRFHEGDLG